MDWGERWVKMIERRRARRRRVRLTWQTCRQCGRYTYLPISINPRCGRCQAPP
jgi:uncharacterized OB-fold protein